MIESHIWERIKTHGPNKGQAILLGDQEMSFGGVPAKERLRSLGYDPCLDIDYNGKASVNHDLNHPITNPVGKASLLYDGGVCEHVANIGQALATIVSLAAVGGVVIQALPVTCRGESYYNVDPILLHDFYSANGFEELELTLYVRSDAKMRLVNLYRRFVPASLRSWVAASAREAVWNKLVLGDTPADFHLMPPDTKRRLPPRTHVLYVGRKAGDHSLVWPHQQIYPDTHSS